MEIYLIEKDKRYYTLFKCSLNEFPKYQSLLETKYSINTSMPVKKNSGFIYFEKEGDFCNYDRWKCSGTCKFHRTDDNGEWLHTNDMSEYYTVETEYSDECVDYEGRE